MAKKKELQIDNIAIERAYKLLQVLTSKERQEILNVIDDNDKIYVGKLVRKLRKEQSVVSAHLRKLAAIGILQEQRKARFHRYPSKESNESEDFEPTNEKELYTSDREVHTGDKIYYASKEKYYSINYERLAAITKATANFLQHFTECELIKDHKH